MPRLTQQARTLFHRLVIKRGFALMTGEPWPYMRFVRLTELALERYERRLKKCDHCGHVFAENEEAAESPVFGRLCQRCYLIAECW